MEGNQRVQQARNKVWAVTQVQVAGGTRRPRPLTAHLPHCLALLLAGGLARRLLTHPLRDS